MAKKPIKTKTIDGQICNSRGTPLVHASNTMTERGFITFLLSGVRRLTRFWKPAQDVKMAARKPVTGMGRVKWLYQCALCQDWYKEKEVQIDHIKNCAGLKDIDDLPRWVRAAFVEIDGYQILCKPCHLIKTLGERNENTKE